MLQKELIESEEVDVCFVCEGIWFDSIELKKIIAADSMDFKHQDVGRESHDGGKIDLNEREGNCPRCKTKMEQIPCDLNSKVTIDHCPKGCGLWLDGGEILRLRRRGLCNFVDGFRNMFSKESWINLKGKLFKRRIV
jgi:Zn-finger nucleic acid-binding protein